MESQADFPVDAAPAGGAGHGAVGAWSSGLFDCFDACGLCCVTCWCPCITFRKVAEIVDRGPSLAGLQYLAGIPCQWMSSLSYRAKLRAEYALPEAPCSDRCVHFGCEPCALVQEYKELKARGFDPEIGWQRNVERGNGGVGSAPGMQHMGR